MRTEELINACALGLVDKHERMRECNTGNVVGGVGPIWAAVTAPRAGRVLPVRRLGVRDESASLLGVWVAPLLLPDRGLPLVRPSRG